MAVGTRDTVLQDFLLPWSPGGPPDAPQLQLTDHPWEALGLPDPPVCLEQAYPPRAPPWPRSPRFGLRIFYHELLVKTPFLTSYFLPLSNPPRPGVNTRQGLGKSHYGVVTSVCGPPLCAFSGISGGLINFVPSAISIRRSISSSQLKASSGPAFRL